MHALNTDFSSRLKDRIATLIGPQRFKVWFKNATQFTLTEGFLKVGVPNHFIGGWIERHFADVIQQAARDVLERDIELTYVLDPSLVRNLRKTQLNSQAASVLRSGNGNRRRPREVPDAPPRRQLRGRLETFVVGPSNRLAYNAALSVVEQRPTGVSALFLHSGCGLGKTHLLHGIANALGAQNENGRRVAWIYVSGEEFTNQFLYALKDRNLDAFRRRFRTVDLLLVDDVHFLANKKATQDEFLHTFNAIDMVGKRIVLASDAPPRMIGQMFESLTSRFASGMVVRIDAPDHATRCDILRRRAAALQAEAPGTRFAIPAGVVEYVADKVRSNIRELEGALLRVLAFASMSDAPVTLHLARQALELHVSQTEPILTAEHIESVVATFFGLTAADLHTSRKTRTIALARSIAMNLARKHTTLSFPEIGRLMGNKNHSTVLLACRRIARTLEQDGEVAWQTAAGIKKSKLATLIARLEEQFAS